MSDPAAVRPMAVAIPCYNEAAAIEGVVREWRAALPDVEVHVFDNGSTDGTGEVAAAAGAVVVAVPRQGKGHVVQAIFSVLGDRPAVVMIDGDGTYPASAVGPLLAAVLDDRADMAVGVRQPAPQSGAMSPVRLLGNTLIRGAFRVLIGTGPSDLLSGYRVFSPRMMGRVSLRSSGFEIETELDCLALGHGLRVFEYPVPYRPRVEGTQSKLRALRDGARILWTIWAQAWRLRPWRPLLVLAGIGIGVAGLYAAGA